MVELLYPHSAELQQLHYLYPVAVGFIGWLWNLIKDERGKRDGTSREDLEIHHVKPVYRGGTDDTSNLRAVTRPEHALAHRDLANHAATKRDKDANRKAERLIVQRMDPNEYSEYVKRTRK